MCNALESHIRKIARDLHDLQLARLYKIPNDIKVIDGRILHAEQTPVDFIGFTAAGRVILLECKMRKATSLSLGPQGLKAHQRLAINEAHKAGGLGLLAWMNDGEIAMIDAGQVKAYGEGRKSITWKSIPPKFKHPVNEEPIRLFWPFLAHSHLAR